MNRKRFWEISLMAILGFFCVFPGFSEEPAKPGIDAEVTQGALRVEQEDGTIVECPLKHTDVKADISGFIARVRVTQTFLIPSRIRSRRLCFSPPHRSAVDEMSMVIGERRIVGIIKRREEAEGSMNRPGAGADRQFARTGTAEYLHSIGGEYSTGPGSEDRNLLCRCPGLRHGRL